LPPIADIQGKLEKFFKDLLQKTFEAEMDEHFGYEKHDLADKKSGKE
jgi:transposase-like protein